ncbi:MAG: thiamine phosphate synthase [Pseudomonadota bacterium]
MALNHAATPPAKRALKLRAAARAITRHFPTHLPPFLFLTDPVRTPTPEAEMMTLPPECGIVFRHFGDEAEIDFIHEFSTILHREGRIFLIAADPELALETGATGVHWPEKRLKKTRHWRGKFQLQTASAHSARALRAAAKAEMDAVLLSPIFPSNSPSAGRLLSPARFRSLAESADLPIYGLGGLNMRNFNRITSSAGIAAIDGFGEKQP